MSVKDWQLLIVDDDVDLQQDLATRLQAAGYSVHVETDVDTAIIWCRFNFPAIIFLGVDLIGSKGLMSLRYLHSQFPSIPIIAMSAVDRAEDVIAAWNNGAYSFLRIPVDDDGALKRVVSRALSQVSLIEENRQYKERLERSNRELEEYVRLLERDQKAGRKVQHKLMPRAPRNWNGVDVDYTIIPSLYLSGDFVDFGCVSERYLAFYLTDVSGHGAASAFVTVWLKQLVRRCFRDLNVFDSEHSFERDLIHLVKLINREVFHARFGIHLTCFVGVIDTHTSEMRYVVAGHLPLPILCSDDAPVRFLEGAGKPVGIFETAEWELNSITLPARFSLIVFSDGVFEILPQQELIQKEQYLLEVVAANHEDISSLCDALSADTDHAVPDDIAIMRLARD